MQLECDALQFGHFMMTLEAVNLTADETWDFNINQIKEVFDSLVSISITNQKPAPGSYCNNCRFQDSRNFWRCTNCKWCSNCRQKCMSGCECDNNHDSCSWVPGAVSVVREAIDNIPQLDLWEYESRHTLKQLKYARILW